MSSYLGRMGDYPNSYNPAIHGRYDPAKFYGKKDTPFGELKIGEIGAWVGRREKSLKTFTGICSRAFWRWQHKYVQPKRSGIAPYFQILFASMAFSYIINHKRIKHHKNYKYH